LHGASCGDDVDHEAVAGDTEDKDDDVLHGASCGHDVDHEAVAGDTEDEDDDVQRDEHDAQPRLLHRVIVDDAEVI